MQLAGEILDYMNNIISTKGAKKLGIQFGAYATFMSFFGLADLQKATADFTGIVDYASSMVFELFTNADVAALGFPSTQDVQVRFLFHNGTASNASEPTVFPLFGGSADAVSWTTFQDNLKEFAITTTEQWCNKCGDTTGACAAFANNDASAASAKPSSGGSTISPAIGGVIGAFVTLAVVLGSLALLMLLGGFRLVSKKALARGGMGASVEPKA